jgi:hypothetical protein
MDASTAAAIFTTLTDIYRQLKRPRKVSWGQSGLLTTSIVGGQASNSVVVFQDDFGPNEAGPFSVSFFINNNPQGAAAATVFQAEAVVTYRDPSGTPVQRRCSLPYTTSIQGVGSSVSVRVFDVPVAAASGGVAGNKYTVSIACARGARPALSQLPTLFGGAFTVLEASNVVVPIPQDAGVCSVLVMCVSGLHAVKPEVAVTQQNPTGALGAWDPTINAQFVPIAPGATQIKIANVDPGNNTNATVFWGIDG